MKRQKVDADIMEWAEEGARLQRDRIYALFPRLRPALRPAAAAGSAPPDAPPAARPRRRMSKAARKRISDAQKARWAAKKR